MVSKDHPSAEQSTALPPDIFGIIAEHLVAYRLYGTCAALNATASYVREETTHVLWRRMLYRWGNGQNSKKKSAVRWKGVFGSESAKYIQFVMVVPSSPPSDEALLDKSPWVPPFVPLILANPHNRLKAYLTAGPKAFSISLTDKYKPCSIEMISVLGCIYTMFAIVGRKISLILIRSPEENSVDPSDENEPGPIDHQGLRALVSDHSRRYNLYAPPLPIPDRHLPVQYALRVSRTSEQHDESLSKILLDTVLWQGSGINAVCDHEVNPRQEVLRPDHLSIHILGQTYSQALACGRAIRALYATNYTFVALNFQVDTGVDITAQQARDFVGSIRQAYLKAVMQLRNAANRACGAVYLNIDYNARKLQAGRPGHAKLKLIYSGKKGPEDIKLFYVFQEFGTTVGALPEREFLPYDPDDDSDWEGEADLKAKSEFQRLARVVNQSAQLRL